VGSRGVGKAAVQATPEKNTRWCHSRTHTVLRPAASLYPLSASASTQGKWADQAEWWEYVGRYHAVVTRALPPSTRAHVVVRAPGCV
jgi:hypothetical protein